MMTLTFADYVVFGLLLLISALVGPYYMWRDRNKPATSESYFVANRGLHFIPTAASLFASFWSAIALVGIPVELYTGGAKFFMSSFGQAIGIAIGAFVAVPVVYRMKLISSYEYFELRFRSRLLRKIGTISNVFAQAFYLAVVTYAPCIALEAVSPIPVWASVTATASVTMIYTVLGGIKAVVIVDLIQAIVMFGGVIVAIIVGYMKIDGGFSRAMEIAREGGRLDFVDLDPDPTNTYNFWIMVLPPIFANAGIYATSQAAVQRYSALPTIRQASWSIMSLAPQIIILKVLLFFMALAMFAHYDAQGCDPLRGGIIANPNQLTTFYIADILHNYPGLVGLWFSALFSGSLSTMSTGYNSVAACIWEDLLKDRLQSKLTAHGVSTVLKVISLLLGTSTVFIAVFFKFLGGGVIKLTNSTVSIFGAAIYIAFFSGALFPFVNAFGTIIGMIFATLLITFVAGGQMYYRLGNEQVWLPTKTANCSAMLAGLISSGKWTPTPDQMNATKAVAASFMLLTASPAAVLNVANNGNTSVTLMSNATFIGAVEMIDEFISPPQSINSALMTSGSGEPPSAVLVLSSDATAENSQKYQEIVSTTEIIVKNESSATLQPWMTLPKPLLFIFSISYFIFPFLSLLAGFAVAIAVSLCTGGLKMAETVPGKYMVVKNCFFKGQNEDEMEPKAESWCYDAKKSNSSGCNNKDESRPAYLRTNNVQDEPVISLTPEAEPENQIAAGIIVESDYYHGEKDAVANEADEDDDGDYVNISQVRENRREAAAIRHNPIYSRLTAINSNFQPSDATAITVELQPLVPST